MGYFLYAITVCCELIVEFGFFIDKLGKRAKADWLIYWVGNPMQFSYSHPYIIGYDPSFIEIRHIDTGSLQQIIPVTCLRVIDHDPTSPDCVMDVGEQQLVFRLKPLTEYLQ
jgi:hypothetical protein